MQCFRAPEQDVIDGIRDLWRVFEEGLCEGKIKTRVVGISKAILLVTKGRIGPAFDSTVRTVWDVYDSKSYLGALRKIADQLAVFESREGDLEEVAASAEKPAAVGRAVDMVFGPH